MAGVDINEHWTERPKVRLEKELGKGKVLSLDGIYGPKPMDSLVEPKRPTRRL